MWLYDSPSSADELITPIKGRGHRQSGDGSERIVPCSEFNVWN